MVTLSSSSATQIQSGTDSCVTPTAPNKVKGDEILPLPPLAVPIQYMGKTQNSFQSNQQTMSLGSPGRSIDSPGRRLDPPVFEGHNPDDWIFRMEKWFLQHHIGETQKLEEALAC